MITNEYLLDVDIKMKTVTNTPVFRRGDTAVLKFRVHDNTTTSNVAEYNKAEITIVMPSGMMLRDVCTKERLQGILLARFQFQKIHTIEIGVYSIYLTLFKGEDRISIPPIKVRFEDNSSDEDFEFADIILELEKEIQKIKDYLNLGIKMDEINVPNGVAGLDASKKIPIQFLLEYMEEHIIATMYKEGAHGFKIDEDGKAWVLVNGNWVKVNFSQYPMGGGEGSHTPPSINIENGNVTVTFPSDLDVGLTKWDKGIRDIPYFQTNGFTFTNNSFTVDSVGNYTLYYKLYDGTEYVVVFMVTEEDLKGSTKTPIKDLPNGTIVIFGETEWILLDNKKGYLATKSAVAKQAFNSVDDDFHYNKDKEGTIAYYLNKSSFTSRFSPNEYNAIIENKWDIRESIADEAIFTTPTKIGMLSDKDAYLYSALLSPYINSNYFYTLTPSYLSEQSKYIKTYFKNVFSGGVSTGSSSMKMEQLIRPAIYLSVDYKVDTWVEEEDIPFNQFNDGDLVKFSGMRWRIIDKTKGLLMYEDDSIFKPFDGLYNWFEKEFIYSLSSQAQGFLQTNAWDTSFTGQSENTQTRNGYVGLISSHYWNKYKNTTMKSLFGTIQLFISNKDLGAPVTSQDIILPMEDGNTNYYTTLTSSKHGIFPLVKINTSTTRLGRIDLIEKTFADCLQEQEVIFGGYTWIKTNDDKLILKSEFKYDEELISYATNMSDKGFNLSYSNIGYQLNSSFYNGNLYRKSKKHLQDMQVNAGLVGNESSKLLTAKLSLIPNRDWEQNYSTTLYDKLDIKKDFWLLNWENDSTGQYLDSKLKIIANGNPTTKKTIIKPIIQLSSDTMMLVEKMDGEIVYAHIPDPELRKILNKILGNGSIADQITVEEMLSITTFSASNMGVVSDLTGMELLKNCSRLGFTPDQYNLNGQVNFTDITPIIELGKGKILVDLEIYSVDKNQQAIYNQLKGKFPNIITGGIKANSISEIIITLAQLQGKQNGVYADKNISITPLTAQQGGGYYITATFNASGDSPIKQTKNINDNDYVTMSAGAYVVNMSASLPPLETGTDIIKYTLGVIAENGDKEEIYIKFDQDFVYYWTLSEQEPYISNVRQNANRQSLILPEKVDGIDIYAFGTNNNNLFPSNVIVRNLTIPKNYKKIYQCFMDDYSLENIYSYSENIDYVLPDKAFKKANSGTRSAVTFHASQNSTTYTLYQQRTSSNSGQDSVTRALYKFKIT